MYDVPEQNVILGYGAEDLLKRVIHYYLSIGHQNQKILSPTFSWWYYKSIADEVNGITILYPLYEEGNDFKYDIEEIKRIAEEEQPKMVLLASPNNPTGNSLTLKELRTIVESLPKECVIILDEAYSLFSNKDLTYIKHLIKDFPNLIIIRTLSKFYGLPGLRLGFGFVGDGLKQFVDSHTLYLGYNKFIESLGIAALKSTDFYSEKAEVMTRDKELYQSVLNPLEGFKVYNSDANFVLVKYPIELKDKIAEALKRENIVVKFMNEEGLRTHMRITLGTTPINKKVIETIRLVAQNR